MPRSKYGAVPTTVDNVRFASKREAKRYSELKLLEKIGEITEFEWNKEKLKFPFKINGVLVCTYEADFSYVNRQGHKVYEDTKGFRTPAYRIKNRLMLAINGIQIQEV